MNTVLFVKATIGFYENLFLVFYLGIHGGLQKWPVTLGFVSGDRSFFQTPLNLLSQTVSPITLLISHYLYTLPQCPFLLPVQVSTLTFSDLSAKRVI